MSTTQSDKTTPKLETSWFTFGQDHAHRINGTTLDRNIVLKITAEDPREVMFQYFDTKWAMEYDKEPNMSYFPRGVLELPGYEENPT